MNRIAALILVGFPAFACPAASEEPFHEQPEALRSLDSDRVAVPARSPRPSRGTQAEGDGLYTPDQIRAAFPGSEAERVVGEQEAAINQHLEESGVLWPASSSTGGLENTLDEMRTCTIDTYPGALWFESSRFLLVTAFTGFDGVTKLAGGTQFSDASGYFWWFGPDNAELVIKILAGCGGSPPGHWVFFSGLTNFSFTLRILDRWTGRQLDLHNTLGNTAQPYINQTYFSCP